MRLNSIRRAQLVAPFGPGALHVLEGGIAVVTGGLDDWFKDRSGNAADVADILNGPLFIREPRLEGPLEVSHFRLAPGPENRGDNEAPELVTPVFRFPTWFVCPRCNRMTKGNLNLNGVLRCQHEDCKRQKLQPVRFAALCDFGHLQDFPWLEWAHRGDSFQPECANFLRFEAGGSGSLDDIRIRCERCPTKPRALHGVMSGDLQSTERNPNGWSGLSRFLRAKSDDSDSGEAPYLCQGHRPWLGNVLAQACLRPLRAVLINATNVHYADVRSAIYIPPQFRPSASDLAKLLDQSTYRSMIRMCRQVEMGIPEIVLKLRSKDEKSEEPKLKVFSNEQIERALRGHGEAPPTDLEEEEAVDNSDRQSQELLLRADEYQAFLGETDRQGELVLKQMDTKAIPSKVAHLVEKVVAIEKLRETRVFAGFSRLLGRSPKGAPHPQSMLWRVMPGKRSERWLPAAVVFGEGIFLTLNETEISSWEKRPYVVKHLANLQCNHDACVARYGWSPLVIEPRLVLLHTLAHLLINRLVFECGYGSASLRERLYVSSNPAAPMAGILIYTAAGDSEGTLGGLVRLADPATLGTILTNALEEAQWCSADPVCAEAADSGGQGPDSLNLAACHSCGLLPETSCEHFNRFLDRSVFLKDHPASIWQC